MEEKIKDTVENAVVEGVEETPKGDILEFTQEDIEKLAKERAIELTNSAVQERIKKITEKHEKEKEIAVADALKKAKMTAEEIKVEEFDELLSKYESLEREHNNMIHSATIKAKLVEAGLPTNDALVKSLIPGIEGIDSIISDLKANFDNAIQKEVDDKLKTSSVDFTKGINQKSKPTRNYRSTASQIGVRTTK